MNEDILKLDHQLCFPLYVAAKTVINRYQPLLEAINLTYTQYIAMMVLWERKTVGVKELGDFLHLDSGTLTPLLKRLEQKGFVKRTRSSSDERVVHISMTREGENLKKRALEIPGQISKSVPLTQDEANTLYRILYQLIDGMDSKDKR